ncbi:MAG: HAMP domain-containing protein [Anaerolineales bacterium]|nr:HAMP domain-containing protein [Anaerolineales bacterium]
MSLRLRLTLWYSVVLAGVLGLFGVAVYGILSYSLLDQIDQNLTAAAKEIADSSSISPVLGSRFINLPDLRKEDRFGGANIYAQVWWLDGSLATQTDNLPSRSEPLDAGALADGTQGYSSVRFANAHLRVLTIRLISEGDSKVIGFVQTASSLRQVDTAQSILLLVLVGGGVVSVALAALTGYLSASRALKPLKVITQTALQITRADDLSRRIPITNSGDEVGRLSAAFNESLERLERLFTAQRRFLADVSHELRTPLTAIRGNVDLLERMGSADRESLRDIRTEAERMTRLVGDLLVLAQADSGNLPLGKAPVALDTLLLEVAREVQVLAGGVHVLVGEIDQLTCLGDRDRLKQVILNLVTNSLKFTPAGGRVTLGLGRVNDFARLTVADTGLGIPPDEIGRIFDRFYRVDKARSRAMGGAGLGLAIAQRITQMHNGRIEAASDGVPGKGTTFAVWLPLAARKELEAARAADTKPLSR